jgi:hypothetical protein
LMREPNNYPPVVRLKQFLESRGAEVSVRFPTSEGEEAAVRLDGERAAGHLFDELPAPDAHAPHPLPEGEQDGLGDAVPQYEETSEGLVWNKRIRRGIEPTPLTNFRARIVGDVLEDDGAGCIRRYEMESDVGGRMIRCEVVADEYRAMNWVPQYLGADAIVHPGSGVRDHARAAIQRFSMPVPRRTVYTHFGWRQLEQGWAFLHTGGAIGAAGAIEGVQVKPPRGLETYQLPDPGDAAAVREGLRRSLQFLNIASREQTWPLLAAVYTAPLAELLHCDFALWLYGPTGSRKSTIAALLLCHFGEFDRYHLPANFTSTANAVELVLFSAKDTLLVIDDYAPPMDGKTAAQQDNVAHRLLRGVGDTRGRNRVTSDVKLRGEKGPRALPLVTAELPPPGSQSSEARTLQVEWRPESVDLDRLTRAQQGDALYFAIGMSGYLQSLAPRMDTIRARMPEEVRKAAQKFPGEHGRCRDTAAKLSLGVRLFLNFAEKCGAIDAARKRVLTEEAHQALAACAERTGRQQADRRPTVLFLENLRALLAQGRGYLADRNTGEAPGEHPEQWGYSISSTDGVARPHPAGEKLGWVDLEDQMVYLLPLAAHRAVTRYSQGSGLRFPVTQRMLGEHLDRERLLAHKSKGRRELRVRAQGGSPWCWAIPAVILFPDTGNSENHEND